MKHFYWTSFFKIAKKFYRDEKGVYLVITALLTFPLLVLTAFTVESTGLLLDKARLSQGMDQAALALIAENNKYRENKKHSEIARQKVTQAEIHNFFGDTFQAQQDKRNQELIQGITKLYMRSEHRAGPQDDLQFTVDSNFRYKCDEVSIPTSNSYNVRKPVVCEVEGAMNRKYYFPLSETLIGGNSGRLKMDAGRSYAIKERGVVIPVELMLVADFSGSMHQDLNGRYNADKTKMGQSKISILREVVGEISQILLPKTISEDISPFNRMGFATFSGGARQRNETQGCILPYEAKDNSNSIKMTVEAWITGNNTGTYWNTNANRWDTNWVEFKNHYNGKYTSFDGCYRDSAQNKQYCYIQADPKKIMDYAFQIQDWTTIRIIFSHYMDTARTINQIDTFNGENRNYKLSFNDENYCLGSNNGKQTTRAWFDQKNKNLSQELNKINPQGWTSASSGLIVGANLIMDYNKDSKAKPDQVGTNTQRVILVLSDGEDNWPYYDTLVTLLNAGICDKIRTRVDSLQASEFKKLPTRIAFVAFGYSPPQDQVNAWKKCVGDQYYTAYSKKELLDTFKQIIGFEEEVGRSSNSKTIF
ncbi:TadE/TadG family type IV pilus assembly protein [Pasteurella multocida]|uniref:TadE/TadG family type IV pilus assembly protein n=1 Tax=Pasteurella multocida TaxID=747 RepID=UPI002447F076|nr:pilus assembly protein [Pasteurella multocida]MDH3003254.1 pilus assembly protein TadG [Pasteurella multocida]